MANGESEAAVVWFRRKGGCGKCPPTMEVTPMPTFSTLPIGEARARSATGKRAALLQEYVGYIECVAPARWGSSRLERVRRRRRSGAG